MNSKYAAAFIIVAMMIAAFPIMASADDSDASLGTTTGQYTIFYYDSTSGAWNHATASTYDAAQALKSSGFWMSGDSMVDKTTGGTYPSPNYNYGDISTFRGIAESGNDVWNVLVYQSGSWVVGSAYLGWYTCFSDQPTSWQTANIAFYYGDGVSDSVITGLNNYISSNSISLSTATSVLNDNFSFTFYIQVKYDETEPTILSGGNIAVTSDDLYDGIKVTAYGSNAYLALVWAFGSETSASDGNVSGVDSIPGDYNSTYDYWTYSGWLYSLFGLSTVQTEGASTPSDWTDDKYAYWVIYDQYAEFDDESDNKADYVLGQYAPLSCAIVADNTIALIYEETTV